MTDLDQRKLAELIRRVEQLELELASQKRDGLALQSEVASLKRSIRLVRTLFKAAWQEFSEFRKVDEEAMLSALSHIGQLWERVDPLFEKIFPEAYSTIRQMNRTLGVNPGSVPPPDPKPRKS